MAYTPYYTGGWQSGEEGGTPITPAALNNMEDGIGAALTAGDIVNNLTSTSTTKPLSAAQGKELKDTIEVKGDSLSVTYGGVSGTASFAKAGYVKLIRLMISGGAFSTATGVDLIGVAPSGYIPTRDTYLVGLARDSGTWASANYVPFDVFISSSTGNIQIMGSSALKTCTYITMSGVYI